jgi:uncharacterized membrane-anchored protein YjiN (DUF445 family)
MKNTALQSEEISIISDKILRLRLVPKKAIERKDSILLAAFTDITRKVKGRIESYVTETRIPDKLDIAIFGKTEPFEVSYWKKIGNYVEDVMEELDYDRTTNCVDLYFGNKRICLKTINSVAPTEQSGTVEERKHVYSNWKEKRRLENLTIVRKPISY